MIPAIFGCAGTVLTSDERTFFARVKPAGFIIFARNVEDPDQLAALIKDMKTTVGRHKVPILIDQEGGRVQRLSKPYWREYPAMGTFGKMAEEDPTRAASALRLNCRLIADDLRRVGINVNCLPVLDVMNGKADPVIGDRAFSSDPNVVSAFGRIVIDALQEGGVLPVVKHLPGHGRAKADSHLELPVVDASVADMDVSDFMPFKALSDAPFGMTAHIKYSDIDPKQCATLSKVVIGRIIRMKMGFTGLLMSDDLSMKALTGSFENRARLAFAAGCDLALHCNGNMEEMQAVASACHVASTKLEKRLASLISEVDKATPADRGDLIRRYETLMNGN